MSKENIDQKYINLAKILENNYYTDMPTLTHEQFDQQHGALWDAHEAELIAEGYIEPAPVVTDWVKEYTEAKTDTERINIIARKAGLK